MANIVTTPYATVDTAQREVFYAASMFDDRDWRIYEIGPGENQRWVLRFTGPDAELKAKAVALILHGEVTS